MKFILIIIIWTYGSGANVSTSVGTAEFNNLAACEIAMNNVKATAGRGLTVYCLAKGTEKKR